MSNIDLRKVEAFRYIKSVTLIMSYLIRWSHISLNDIFTRTTHSSYLLASYITIAGHFSLDIYSRKNRLEK